MTDPSKINQIIADSLGFPIDRIELSDEFQADLGADSLDMVELTMALEDGLGLTIGDDEAAACRTVADVHDLVGRKQRG